MQTLLVACLLLGVIIFILFILKATAKVFGLSRGKSKGSGKRNCFDIGDD